MKEPLLQYLRHKLDCNAVDITTKSSECTCGLSALLYSLPTNPLNWMEFETELESNKLKDLGVDNSYPSPVMFNMNEIIFYYKSKNDEDEERVRVYFKGGESISISITYDEFKKIVSNG